MGTRDTRIKIHRWFENAFTEARNKGVFLNKKMLISYCCLTNYVSERYATDILKLYQMNKKIKIKGQDVIPLEERQESLK